jgi:hypothetical protein
MNPLRNLFIQNAIKNALHGDTGSNVLTAVLAVLVGAHIDWMLAFHGITFQDSASVAELAKVVGLVLFAVYGWLVGKYPAVAKYLSFAEQAEDAAKAAAK